MPSALKALLGMPKAWPFAVVPVLIFLLLESVFVSCAVIWLQPWLDAQLSSDRGWLDAAGGALSWLLTAAAAVLGWLASLLLAPPLSAPALERIVSMVEAELGVPERHEQSVAAEFWCGLRSMLLASALTVPIIVALTILELLLPPAVVVATPLKLLIGALGAAWGLFDYPLTLRGVGARARFAQLMEHFSVVLGFGTAFALVALVPCCSVVMLPVGVVAATRLIWEIQGEAGKRAAFDSPS